MNTQVLRIFTRAKETRSMPLIQETVEDQIGTAFAAD
jgi:hypothetical protein